MSNLRKVITVMSSASSLALILAGTAMAAPPTGFNTLGQWNVSSTGVVTATCPATFICSTVADGAGFLQQEVTDGAGIRHVRTLIGEGFAAAGTDITRLTFASEDYIRLGGTPGLASAMTIKDSTIAVSSTTAAPGSVVTAFSSSAQILSGWGTLLPATNQSEAILGLALSDAGAGAAGVAGGDEFMTSFSVSANTTLAGLNVTNALDVDQTIYVGGLAANMDRQRFVTEVKTAAALHAGFKFAANTTDPALLNWAAGDKIQVVWAGQNIGGAGSFSTESLIQLTGTTLGSVTGSNQISPSTFEWTSLPATTLNSEFGLKPEF